MSKFKLYCERNSEKYIEGYNKWYKKDRDLKYAETKIYNENLSNNQYIQAASEMMLYLNFNKNKLSFETDVKVNDLNKTDVDFVVSKSNFKVNIEVKTPEINQREEKILYGAAGSYRYDNNRATQQELDKAFSDISRIFSQMGKIVEKKKKDDNKLKDYLVGANTKFNDSTNQEMNVLVICLDTDEMNNFLKYICNSCTGIFTENSFIDKSNFEKTDCIVLSNCVENHIETRFSFDYWDMDEYINFVIPNYNNKKKKNKNIVRLVTDIFKDKFFEFAKYAETYIPIPSEGSINKELSFLGYIAEKHPCFNLNKDKRVF